MESQTTTQFKNKSAGFGNILKKFFFGFGLFLSSFAVLYFNEGRVDLSLVAQDAIELDTKNPDPAADGKLVSVTDLLHSDHALGDKFLKAGDYLFLHRIVEMYSWEEHSETDDETDSRTYDYTKTWTEDPEDSSTFYWEIGHINPEKTVKSDNFLVSDIKIGDFSVDKTLTLPSTSEKILKKEDVIETGGFVFDGKYMYSTYYLLEDGEVPGEDPDIGDMRISYEFIRNPIEQATVLGKANLGSGSVEMYIGPKESQLYRAFEGTKEDAIKTLKFEHEILSWTLRVTGFLMMWLGLRNLLSPFVEIFRKIPFLFKFGNFVVAGATFIVAGILSIITILLSIILHNVFMVITVLVLIVAWGISWGKSRKKRIMASIENEKNMENITTM